MIRWYTVIMQELDDAHQVSVHAVMAKSAAHAVRQAFDELSDGGEFGTVDELSEWWGVADIRLGKTSPLDNRVDKGYLNRKGIR